MRNSLNLTPIKHTKQQEPNRTAKTRRHHGLYNHQTSPHEINQQKLTVPTFSTRPTFQKSDSRCAAFPFHLPTRPHCSLPRQRAPQAEARWVDCVSTQQRKNTQFC